MTKRANTRRMARPSTLALVDVQQSSLTPPVSDLQVVVPVDAVAAQLPKTGDGVATVGEGAGEPLREPRRVPPQPPCFLVDAHAVDTEHAARVEVVHAHQRSGGGRGVAARRVAGAVPPGDPGDRD